MTRPSHRATRLFLPFVFIISCLLLQSIRLTGDGLSYYAYLRSVLFDGDLDFANEFIKYNPLGHATPDPAQRTATGLVANPFAVGPAFLWAPFVLPVHLVYMSIAALTSGAVTGYELPYVAAAVFGTNFVALLGWLAAVEVASRYASRSTAVVAVLAVVFGSAYVNYLYFDPAYSHVLSASLVALFIWNSLCFLERPADPRAPLVAGLLGGLMILTRWQNIFFLAVPAVLIAARWLGNRRRGRREPLPTLPQLLLFGVILFVLQLPQLAVWRALYGAWLTVPMGGAFIRLEEPALLQILLSPRNGLFSWTPLVALGLLGMLALFRLDTPLALGLSLVVLAQWYLNATIADWWGGSAFGARRFIGSSLVFIVGLATIIRYARRQRPHRLAIYAMLLGGVIWNLLLWTQYVIGSPPVRATADLGHIYAGQLHYGLANVYRLLGRGTWIDLAVRSGVLEQNWGNVGAALVWLAALVAVAFAATELWLRLTSWCNAGTA
ncbi:MAG: hypothetical protein R3272_01130 [Candidatus Promineifilaceae bacterium]|nr:hypothetical protein [Candidatus Promineifilaceae bacterium]